MALVSFCFYEILDCPVDFFLSYIFFFFSYFVIGAFFSILSSLSSLCQSWFCYTQKLELREQEKLLGEDGEAYDQHFDGYNRPEDTVAFSTFSTRFVVQPSMLSALLKCLFFLMSVVVLFLVVLCLLHCRWNGVCMVTVKVFALVLVNGS